MEVKSWLAAPSRDDRDRGRQLTEIAHSPELLIGIAFLTRASGPGPLPCSPKTSDGRGHTIQRPPRDTQTHL